MNNNYISSTTKLKLGVLDLGSFWYYKQPSMERVLETIKTAVKAEKLGFHRYWVAEHHSKEVAWRGTDIILTLIAGHTSKIRVGSAGILLNYYSPFLISENYKLLANLFDNRIDLGLAQGLAETKIIDEILTSDKSENAMSFLEKVEFLKSVYFHPTDQTLVSPPYDGVPPDLWIMGTSLKNLDFAIEKKLNYCLSLCHKRVDVMKIDEMKEKIKVLNSFDETNDLPEISIMVSVICGKTQKKAEAMAKRAFTILNISHVGDQNSCYEFLMETKESFGVSEIIIADLCGNQRDRVTSLTLLSEINKI
jgi:luciferase family oxidoreductase group 1